MSSLERGFPIAFCTACDAEQLVWRNPETGAAACLGCDAPLDEGAVRRGGAEDISDRNDYVFLDVTLSAEPCGCDHCPAAGKCSHTREDGAGAEH